MTRRGIERTLAGLAAIVAWGGLALQFWLVARAFRSRRPGRDFLIAVALSLIVYLAFSRGLGLPLPAGILEGLL